MNGEGRVITQVGYGTVGGGAAADPRAQAPGPSKGVLQWLRDWWGGWAGPKASVHSPAAYELERERLRGGPPHLVIPQFLPYFDDSSGETATMRLAYRKMMADPNVKSALLGKILAVAALDLQVQPADKKNGYDKHVADFVTWNFTRRLRGAIPELVWAVLSGGLIDGYAVVEKVIVPEHRGKWSGKFILSQLKPKDTYYDLVLQADEYRNVVGVMGLRYNAGEVFHPANFVVYRHLPLYGAPTGASDLRAVYSRYWLLDTALKLRAIGLEKRALPVMHGTYPAANPTVKGSLEAALASLSSKNWLATPAEAQVQALNIAGTSDDIFAGAIRDLKHDIFLGIQGAILQALEGTITDGRGASSVHSSTADLLKWHLSAVISALLNDPESGLIRDIVDLNFVVSEYPWASLSAIDLSVLLQELQIDNGLRQMGLPLSKDEIYERYGRKPPETPDDEMAPAGPDAGPPGGPGHPGGTIGTAGAPPMPKLPDPSKGPGSDRRGESVGAGGAKSRGSPFSEFADGDWDESKVKRAADGRFGSKPGQRSRNERQKAKREKRQARRQERPDTPPRDEAPARPSPEAREQVKASLLDKLLTVAPAKAKEWAGKLKQKAWESLTPAEQKLCGAVAAVEHAMASGPSELAAEAARQRGLSDEQAEAVRKAARGADLAFAWTLNVPVAHDVLHHAGVGHAVGEAGAAIAAKVGYYLPVGSLSYLAYSTARNPLATIRAAKAVIEKALATRHAEGDWEEGKHPRDDSGQFTSGGGGGSPAGGASGSRREAHAAAVAKAKADHESKVKAWQAESAAVSARNQQAKAAWEERASARQDRRDAAEALGEAKLIADEMPLSRANPEDDEGMVGAEKTPEGRQRYAERAAEYVATAVAAFGYDAGKLAQVGVPEKAVAKLQKALERGKAAVQKAGEKWQKALEKSMAAYAKVQEIEAQDISHEEPTTDESLEGDEYDAAYDQWVKDHDAWSIRSDAWEAKRDAAQEKADALDDARSEAYDALQEAFEEHRGKADDVIDEATSTVVDEIDEQDEADPEPDDEELPDEPEEPDYPDEPDEDDDASD